MDSYARHMFTEGVQALQERAGTKEKYEAVYDKRALPDGLDDRTADFIRAATSFYIASVGETGWPYVQHRGGPAGFVKLLDDTTLGFADYRGNKQFITTGNVGHDDRVSLFFMDYPHRARLKAIGHARIVAASADADLASRLCDPDGPAPERLTTIRLVALDWNCPQFITPRYTEDEVTALVSPALAARDAEIAALKDRLRALGHDPDASSEQEDIRK